MAPFSKDDKTVIKILYECVKVTMLVRL